MRKADKKKSAKQSKKAHKQRKANIVKKRPN